MATIVYGGCAERIFTIPNRFGIHPALATHEAIYRMSMGYTKEYLSRVAARVETDAENRNLGQMCHALVCRRTESAESTMPLISLELSDT